MHVLVRTVEIYVDQELDETVDEEAGRIRNLRLEGKLCYDLGRPDEATRAVARADEIIDRFPAADPDLVFS